MIRNFFHVTFFTQPVYIISYIDHDQNFFSGLCRDDNMPTTGRLDNYKTQQQTELYPYFFFIVMILLMYVDVP